ncbi:MAG: class I SAM-dependent methyltransferase [Pseudomonadota bacterium]
MQTKDCFGFKWLQRRAYESPEMKDMTTNWMVEKYLGGNPALLDEWLSGGRKIILDAGCGSALSALCLFGNRLKDHDYLGVDISTSVNVAETRFREHSIHGDFLQADLMDIPIPAGSVDMIFCEGVLHHTDDTAAAVDALSKKLKTGGRFLFYVYAKKAPIREFSDDHVREQLSAMTDEHAWEALKPLTTLGIELGRLEQTITIAEDIPLLGIQKGEYGLQRFFYWHICKMYYRPEFSFDAMHLINFDWFRPLNCHRHSEEEVRDMCSKAGLTIETLHTQPSGYTVIALKD